MDLRIRGKTAVVCGASRGLGMACAWALAGEGVDVTLVARHADGLLAAADRIAEATGNRPAVIAADVGAAQGRAAIQAAVSETDMLVTNAGGPPTRDFMDLTLDDWRARSTPIFYPPSR